MNVVEVQDGKRKKKNDVEVIEDTGFEEQQVVGEN